MVIMNDTQSQLLQKSNPTIYKYNISLCFLSRAGIFPTFLHSIDELNNYLRQYGREENPVHDVSEQCKYMNHNIM